MQQISCLTYVPNPCCFRKRRLIFNVHGADWLRFPKPPLHLVCPVITIQREPVSAVSSNINFPMKGRKGMVDWARNSEDKVVIPKGLFVSPSAGNVSRYCPPPDNSKACSDTSFWAKHHRDVEIYHGWPIGCDIVHTVVCVFRKEGK